VPRIEKKQIESTLSLRGISIEKTITDTGFSCADHKTHLPGSILTPVFAPKSIALPVFFFDLIFLVVFFGVF
jgi:hypothetical protein